MRREIYHGVVRGNRAPQLADVEKIEIDGLCAGARERRALLARAPDGGDAMPSGDEQRNRTSPNHTRCSRDEHSHFTTPSMSGQR